MRNHRSVPVPHILLVLLLILMPGTSHGQYMYLDLNGDGESSPADSLAGAGTYAAHLWLVTDRDRDGHPVRCAGDEGPTLKSYKVVLRSVGGSIEWGSYENTQPSMTVSLERTASGSDCTLGFVSSRMMRPGQYRLGIIHFEIRSGTPIVTIVPSTPLGADIHTEIGSSCMAADGRATRRLGVDWYDVRGLGPPAKGEDLPSLHVEGGGHLFVAGNEIPGPWHLAKVQGVITANGMVFPPSPQIPSTPNPDVSGEIQFLSRVGALADSLNRAGVNSRDGARMIAEYCSNNNVGVNVEQKDGSVQLRTQKGIVVVLRMGLQQAWVPNTEPVPRKDVGHRDLEMTARQLSDGCTIFIVNRAVRVIIPKPMSGTALRAVTKVREGSPLTREESRMLSREIQAQIKNPVALVRGW